MLAILGVRPESRLGECILMLPAGDARICAR